MLPPLRCMESLDLRSLGDEGITIAIRMRMRF